jgi:hypothetical protein
MTRTAKVVSAVVAAYLIGVVTPYFASYVFAFSARTLIGEEELTRTTSPDGALDAVVIEDHPGAWGTISYGLFIVPKGARADTFRGDPVMVVSSEGDPLKPNWVRPHFLSVDAGNAHVKFFGNLWRSERLADYYVELTIADTGRRYLQEDGRLRGARN